MLELKATSNLREELDKLLLTQTRDDPIIVSRETLIVALKRFLTGELKQSDLVTWATSLEIHDSVQYEPKSKKLIADVIFYIASPEINGHLDPGLCEQFIGRLSGRSLA